MAKPKEENKPESTGGVVPGQKLVNHPESGNYDPRIHDKTAEEPKPEPSTEEGDPAAE